MEFIMPDRVHHHPNLVYSPGTQVVTLVEVLGQSGKVLHPRGSVGVVVRSPAELDHPYRVRFADGIEESLQRDQVTSGAAALHDLLVRIRLGKFATAIPSFQRRGGQ